MRSRAPPRPRPPGRQNLIPPQLDHLVELQVPWGHDNHWQGGRRNDVGAPAVYRRARCPRRAYTCTTRKGSNPPDCTTTQNSVSLAPSGRKINSASSGSSTAFPSTSTAPLCNAVYERANCQPCRRECVSIKPRGWRPYGRIVASTSAFFRAHPHTLSSPSRRGNPCRGDFRSVTSMSLSKSSDPEAKEDEVSAAPSSSSEDTLCWSQAWPLVPLGEVHLPPPVAVCGREWRPCPPPPPPDPPLARYIPIRRRARAALRPSQRRPTW